MFKSKKKLIITLIITIAILVTLSGCRQASRVSYNLVNEEDLSLIVEASILLGESEVGEG